MWSVASTTLAATVQFAAAATTTTAAAAVHQLFRGNSLKEAIIDQASREFED